MSTETVGCGEVSWKREMEVGKGGLIVGSEMIELVGRIFSIEELLD